MTSKRRSFFYTIEQGEYSQSLEVKGGGDTGIVILYKNTFPPAFLRWFPHDVDSVQDQRYNQRVKVKDIDMEEK